ncbi:MAG: GatB/YqeY domain-containing protein [Chloroflexi bacterium]|nr:GatB/YqeY domain-containing protein [Chloroflexota bacterium]
MDLKARLMADLKEAMKRGDASRRDAIRMVRAAMANTEIELQRGVTDEEIESLIATEVKRRREALELFRRGARQDLAAEEEAQIRILEAYLPRQLAREEIAEVVRRIVAELGATGPQALGPVMKRAMSELKGKADGGLVNQVAREILSA